MTVEQDIESGGRTGHMGYSGEGSRVCRERANK